MTENELREYIRMNYPKENEANEWKEFKNLKNDFNGKEKNDIISYVSGISNMDGGNLIIGVVDQTLEIVGTDTYNYDTDVAKLRIKDQCANVPTDGLTIDEYITDDTQKTVWIIHIPKHLPRLPVYAHSKAYQRIGSSLIDITKGRMDAILFEQCDTDEKANAAFDAAASDLDDVVFAVTPDLMTSCMRAAIRYPQMKILDCSINLKSSAVRTYYPKMYQAKFLMGALAACYANDHRIGYVADYPLNGNIANINAFAIGAGIVDPKAKIYLSWTGRKGNDFEKELEDDLGLKVISGPDAIQPASHSRKYGLYVKDDSGRTKVIAAPICHWGKFYSAIVQTILDGTWNEREKTGKNQPINYWLGMPGGVVDVIFSDKLPYYSRKLLKILKSGVMDGTIEPFRGELRSQSGTLQTEGAEALSYADIVGMDWLNDNIIGSVPKADELVESVQKTVQTSGVTETVRQDDRQK